MSQDDSGKRGAGAAATLRMCSGHLAISAFTALQPILEMHEIQKGFKDFKDVQAEWLRCSMALPL
jgi:hypothetical protein